MLFKADFPEWEWYPGGGTKRVKLCSQECRTKNVRISAKGRDKSRGRRRERRRGVRRENAVESLAKVREVSCLGEGGIERGLERGGSGDGWRRGEILSEGMLFRNSTEQRESSFYILNRCFGL